MRIAVRIALLFILIVSAVAGTSSTSSPLDDAKALIAQGKQKDAIPILDKIVASDPTSAPQALLLMGECYKKLGKWTTAIQTFEKLCADHPNAIAPDREVLGVLDEPEWWLLMPRRHSDRSTRSM